MCPTLTQALSLSQLMESTTQAQAKEFRRHPGKTTRTQWIGGLTKVTELGTLPPTVWCLKQEETWENTVLVLGEQ